MEPTKKDIYSAIAEARKEFTKIVKNKKAYNYMYADLDNIYESIDMSLAKAGLVKFSKVLENGLLKTTVRCLTTGEELDSYYPLQNKTADQDIGKSITYGRRYNITCLLDLTTEEDTDGIASKHKPDSRLPNNSITNQASNQSMSNPNDLGSFRFPFGKIKGKMFKDVPQESIQSALEWAQSKSPGKDGKPLFQDFQDAAIAYLSNSSYDNQEFPEGF